MKKPKEDTDRACLSVGEDFLVVLDNLSVKVESLRCPTCQKLLAKCAIRGMIEIVCPRCHRKVNNVFA